MTNNYVSASSPGAILIVDDDPDIREALSDRLEYEGYRVSAVGLGKEAIAKVREERFGAVVLDMGLPDLHGLSVLKVLMELDPNLPVIVLTGDPTAENIVGSLQKGAFAYLSKPYNLEVMKPTLHRALAVKALQDQLIQAQKMAVLGTLVSGMAHEINNPAQGILGTAEIIRDEPDLEKIREYAQDIINFSKHIAAVVRDFSCYARPASRDEEVEIDLNERLAEAVKMIRVGPRFGAVEVVTDFEPLPRLRARRTEIDQVLVNLISNAVQAMKGCGRLGLVTRHEYGLVTVRISDTGCGIPESLRHRIFDPFVTTKGPGEGTGLGLTIVYQIVTKYGGEISVDSVEGKGTTFTIEFPMGHQGQTRTGMGHSGLV